MTKNFEAYKEAFNRDEKFFLNGVSETEGRGFEYGILTVKHGMLISGGGLLAIPTIVGLSEAANVDLRSAKMAGMAFAASLLFVLISTYVIHWNWMLHAAVWRENWQHRQKCLEKSFLLGVPPEEIEWSIENSQTRWIWLAFLAPHLLAVLYVSSALFGFFHMFTAFGVSS